jgi:lipopolysaccharide transport system permease protein
LHNSSTFHILPAGKQPLLDFADIWPFRHLLVVLAWRNLKLRYQQAVIGVGWAFLQPVMFVFVFTIIFGRLAGMPTNGIPYPIFVMSGLIVWLFVAQAFPQASASIVLNPHLVTRIYFPRIILPIAAIAIALADFLVSLVLLFILMAWYGIAPSAGVMLFVPMMLVAVATVLGLSLWFSALYVPFRDVGHLLPFLVQIWMFLCPVVYPSNLLPEKYAFLYMLNPIAVVIDTSRWAFAGGAAPHAYAVFVSSLAAFAILLSGYWYFRRSEATFADVV